MMPVEPEAATHEIVQALVRLPIAQLRAVALEWGADALAAALDLADADVQFTRQVGVTRVGQS
jgi:hypothetical protein